MFTNRALTSTNHLIEDFYKNFRSQNFQISPECETIRWIVLWKTLEKALGQLENLSRSDTLVKRPSAFHLFSDLLQYRCKLKRERANEKNHVIRGVSRDGVCERSN
jgi:hypothetical protein